MANNVYKGRSTTLRQHWSIHEQWNEWNGCRTWRCTPKEGASSPGTATPLDITPKLQVEKAREEEIEVTSEQMGGEGAGATPLGIIPTADIEDMGEEEIEVTSGEMGKEGVGGWFPPRITPAPPMNPARAVFILSSDSEASRTMPICLNNSGSRVVTRVDRGTELSSCSRDVCQ